MFKLMLKKVLLVIFLLYNRTFVLEFSILRCPLPEGCSFEGVYDGLKEKKYGAIFCEIYNDGYEFKFYESPLESNVTYQTCNDYFNARNQEFSSITLRWPSSNELAILVPKLNMTNLHRYFYLFLSLGNLKLINAKGFDVNILDDHFFDNGFNIKVIDLINCRLDFFNHNKSKFQPCEESIESNFTRIRSIFQILIPSEEEITTVKIENFEFKQTVCPLIFINVAFDVLKIVYLENTFYKNSMLTFSNDTRNRKLNSFIKN